MRLLFGILLLLYASMHITADIASNLIKDEVVPDVLDRAPNDLLRVFYNDKEVNYGEEWTPTSMIPTPTLEWSSDPNSYYSLIMTGPDAPSRAKPTYREFLLWMVTNIPGNEMSKGDTIVEYVGAAPPKDGGMHRIIFTVYQQPGKLSFDEKHVGNRQIEFRVWWSQRAFSRKYKLGDPVAANLVFSSYDDYVPKVHEEFMKNLNV